MDISIAFLTGFLSSLHCAGMCGPLVVAYSASGRDAKPSAARTLFSHLSYNTGRILSYSIVGALLGLIGGTVGALRGVGFWFSGLAGVATILFGLYVLRGGSFVPLETTPGSSGGGKLGQILLRAYRASFGGLLLRGTLESRFYIGLLTPLLPCGLLYGMLVRSAGAAGPLEGAALMAAFGAGIVPSLLAAGVVGSYLSAKTRRWADRIAALLLIVMGASLVWRALMAGLAGGAHAMHS